MTIAAISEKSPSTTHKAWVRIFARIIDYFILKVLLLLVPLTFEIESLTGSALLLNALLLTAIGWVGFIAYDVFFLATFGTSIGKALFGIYVRSKQGGKLTYRQAFARSWRVLIDGFILLLFQPLLQLLGGWTFYKNFKKSGTTYWDDISDSVVEYQSIHIVRKSFAVILAIIFGFAIAVFALYTKSIEKEFLRNANFNKDSPVQKERKIGGVDDDILLGPIVDEHFQIKGQTNISEVQGNKVMGYPGTYSRINSDTSERGTLRIIELSGEGSKQIDYRLMLDIGGDGCTGSIEAIGSIDRDKLLFVNPSTSCLLTVRHDAEAEIVKVIESSQCRDLHGFACTFNGSYRLNRSSPN